VSGSDSSEEAPREDVVPEWARRECGDFFEQTWRVALYRARMLVSHDEAEDVMHDAYALALVRWVRVLHRLLPSQRSAWIKTAVTRVAHDRWRRAGTHDRYASALCEPGADQCPDPADAVVAAATARICLKVIDAMPHEMRAMSLLCWVDGLRPTEVAEVLGLPPGTVRRKLKTARDQLYDLVGAELTFEPKYGKTREGGATR
jgi:RNA polymerase sigma factor (sigma-70 family)